MDALSVHVTVWYAWQRPFQGCNHSYALKDTTSSLIRVPKCKSMQMESLYLLMRIWQFRAMCILPWV